MSADVATARYDAAFTFRPAERPTDSDSFPSSFPDPAPAGPLARCPACTRTVLLARHSGHLHWHGHARGDGTLCPTSGRPICQTTPIRATVVCGCSVTATSVS